VSAALGTYSSARSPLVFLSTRAANETKSENKVNFSLSERDTTTVARASQQYFLLPYTRFQSTYQAVVDVLRREGLLGLYNGLNSSLLGIAVTNGCVTPIFFFPRAYILRRYTKSVLLFLREHEGRHNQI
jgi:hypothetical protein